MKEKWMVKNKSADFKAIAGHFGISEVTARLLVNRGLNDFEAMGCYLAPDISQLHDPQGMKDAGKAAGILAEKISEGKKIRIIGDYDVDGVVATYIFMETLLECGADVDYRIPERVRDGYGLNLRLVEEAAADGVDTILTCDNGIAAVEQVDFAKECGMCVVVTDHHELQEQLPKADALVNPKQMDCSYPYKGLCGAAVAYKVAELIYGACGKEKGSAEKFIAFAAIATVCDVMELTGENRTIVSLGLAALRSSTHCGIQALCAANGITGEALDTYRLGFVLGPCINATGRLETAERGVKLHRMTAIGKGRKMFRFLVEDAYGTQMDALYFGDGEVLEEEMIARYGEDVVRGLYGGVDMGVRMSVVYYPSINEYRDKRTLQIVLQHIMWQDVE